MSSNEGLAHCIATTNEKNLQIQLLEIEQENHEKETKLLNLIIEFNY